MTKFQKLVVDVSLLILLLFTLQLLSGCASQDKYKKKFVEGCMFGTVMTAFAFTKQQPDNFMLGKIHADCSAFYETDFKD